MGAWAYSCQNQITTGNAQPWYASSPDLKLLGGQPTAKPQADFSAPSFQRVQQDLPAKRSFQSRLTNDPNRSPARPHAELDLGYASNTIPGVIGMTQIGGQRDSGYRPGSEVGTVVGQMEGIARATTVSHEI